MTLPVINTQPIEKNVENDEGHLDIMEVFKTIQGEGPFVGHSAIFVRLAGCNLQCPGCDTDYTSFEKRRRMSHRELMIAINELRPPTHKPLIVITGGEPLRQPIGLLVSALLMGGFVVQIETNGTLWDRKLERWAADQDLHIVVSPKAGKVNPDLERYAKAFKYVLRAGMISEKDGLPTSVLGNCVHVARPNPGLSGKHVPIYVQPMDEQDKLLNKVNLDATVEVAQKFGYILGIQLHKYLGLA